MRIRVRDLKKLIREGALFEEKQPEDGEASLDAQVDRYLVEYEGMSKTAKKEGLDYRMTVRRLLGEAGEKGDEQKDGDKEETPVGAPSKLTLDAIDVEEFANNVARLIGSYDSLLEVRNTLLRRSINFIAKSYDGDVVKALEDNLRETHGLVPGEDKTDVDAEEHPAPPADRAGPSPGGGAP